MAKKYYLELKKQQEQKPENERLKIATIFSYSANEEQTDLSQIDEDMDISRLETSSRDFLETVMKDYNKMFNTNFSTDGDGFGNFYKDVSQKIKTKQLDLLIVVNMFLTGFDATTLNTL
jgi:type I restriction enzyme R subunit